MSELIDSSVARQFDRLPPHALDAEMATLCAMAIDVDGRIREAVGAMLPAEAFYQADHKIIFETIMKLHKGPKSVDTVLLVNALKDAGMYEEVGGFAYIAQILNAMPASFNAEHYAAIVLEKYRLRKLIGVANDAIRDAYGAHAISADIATRFSVGAAGVLTTGRSTDYITIGDAATQLYERLESGDDTHTISTGYRDLDVAIGGMQGGEMMIVGGRPSMGKSALLKGIGIRIAKTGVPVLCVSQEENRWKIVRNVLSGETEVENNKFRTRSFNQQEWNRLAAGVAGLADVPFYMNDKSFRMADIESTITYMVAKFGIRVVLVDYLQKIQGERGQKRFEVVTENCLALSRLFKETNVAGIVAAQLKRLDDGDSRPPEMEDLRESGQIEQDADTIILLHRPDYYAASAGMTWSPTREAELHIAKFRDGARGKCVILKSDLKYQRFLDQPYGYTSHTTGNAGDDEDESPHIP